METLYEYEYLRALTAPEVETRTTKKETHCHLVQQCLQP